MASLAYKFCVQAAKVNLKKGDFDKTELKTFENCLNKYDMAFSLYAKEKTTFHNSLDQIRARGGDIFGHLNKWNQIFKHY